MRIDKVLIERGLCRSRSQAQEALKKGWVEYQDEAGWHPVHKASQQVDASTPLRLKDSRLNRYVSRGGLKLEGALRMSGVDAFGSIALDIGQSTGGFTDCLIQAGAQKVVGVDVGHGQLHPSLRENPQVVALEGINARELPVSLLSLTPGQRGYDLVVMDLSFISQTLVWPGLRQLTRSGAVVLSLVKPQFEAGPEWIGKQGLVKSPECYPLVREKVEGAAREAGFRLSDWMESPIEGGDGNREFLAVFIRCD